ncbi:MAG: histidine phosphatase family protein [Chloroflexota bacterium]|nr:histidine phosphatase family protein [Chloroflexota bacterium]
MTTTVLLVRHGRTSSNVSGFYMGWSEEDLDETGYEQARCLSARLAEWSISSVYSSPLQRARSTAGILAEPHGIEPELLEDLIELGLGDWQGLHAEEIKRRWPEIWQQSRIDPSELTMPHGESFRQARERAVRALEQVLEASRGKQVVVVTHEAIVKVLVAHVLGAPNSIYRRFAIDNASLSVVRVLDGKLRLITLNDTAHLQA